LEGTTIDNDVNSYIPSGGFPKNWESGTELLFLLGQSNAPASLYDKILEWTRRYADFKEEGPPSRNKIIGQLIERYNLRGMQPILTPCWLRGSGFAIDVVVIDFIEAVKSLLSDPTRMQAKNLLFDDPRRPNYVDMKDKAFYADLNTGSAMRNYQKKLYRMNEEDKERNGVEGNRVFVGAQSFTDSMVIDSHFAKCSLEAVSITLPIFNLETREAESWRHIGFLKANPHRADMSLGEAHDHGTPSQRTLGKEWYVTEKMEDYHSMLRTIYHRLKAAQASKLKWKFTIDGERNDNVYELDFTFLFHMGDKPAHDKLVGLVGGPNNDQNPDCRLCGCLKEDLDKDDLSFDIIDSHELYRNIKENRPGAVREKGYYPIKDNILHELDYCDPLGFIISTLPEILHVLLLGLLPRLLNGFSNLKKKLGGKRRKKAPTKSRNINGTEYYAGSDTARHETESTHYLFPVKARSEVNRACKEIGFQLSRSPDKDMPRTHFPTGYINDPPKAKTKNEDAKTGKKCGQELPGVFLVLLLYLTNAATAEKIDDDVTMEVRQDFVQVIDWMLAMTEWLRSKVVEKLHVEMFANFLPRLMRLYKKTLDRQVGNGPRFYKFHVMFHLAQIIRRFGVMENVYGGHGEGQLKDNVKKPAIRSKLNMETLEEDTANRFMEKTAMRFAFNEVGEAHLEKITELYNDSTETVPKQAKGSIVQYHKNFKRLFKSPDSRLGYRMVAEFNSRSQLGEVHAADNKDSKAARAKKMARWSGALSKADLEQFLGVIMTRTGNERLLVHTEVDLQREEDTSMQGKLLLRANPTWWKKSWQDWVVAKRHDGQIVPCHCLVFVEIEYLPDGFAPLPTAVSTVSEPGCYAVVHFCPENVLSDDTAGTISMYGCFKPDSILSDPNADSLTWSCKWTNEMANHYTVLPTKSVLEQYKPKLALLNVRDIIRGIVAVEDPTYVVPHCFQFLHPHAGFANLFVKKMIMSGERLPILEKESTDSTPESDDSPEPVAKTRVAQLQRRKPSKSRTSHSRSKRQRP